MVLRWPPLLRSVGETESGHFRIFEIRNITGQSCIYSGCVIGSSRLRPRGLWRHRRRDRLWCGLAASGGIGVETAYGALSRPLAASTSRPPMVRCRGLWRRPRYLRTVLEILSTVLETISTVLDTSCRNRAAIVQQSFPPLAAPPDSKASTLKKPEIYTNL